MDVNICKPKAGLNDAFVYSNLSGAQRNNKKEKAKIGFEKFKSSAKARIIMDQVIERVNNGCILNFDYLCFVCVAAAVARMGLISNSVVAVVASMLISPIMV